MCGGTLGNHTTLHLVMAKDGHGDGGLTTDEDCCQHSPTRSDVAVSSQANCHKKDRGAMGSCKEHNNLRWRRLDYIHFW